MCWNCESPRVRCGFGDDKKRKKHVPEGRDLTHVFTLPVNHLPSTLYKKSRFYREETKNLTSGVGVSSLSRLFTDDACFLLNIVLLLSRVMVSITQTVCWLGSGETDGRNVIISSNLLPEFTTNSTLPAVYFDDTSSSSSTDSDSVCQRFSSNRSRSIDQFARRRDSVKRKEPADN